MPAKTLANKFRPIQSRSQTNEYHAYLSSRRKGDAIVKPQISIPETITAIDEFPALLRLPSEIRQQIFRYLLPSSTKRFRIYTDCDSTITNTNRTTVINTKLNRHPPSHPDKLHLNVLLINRLIYHECLSIIYSENLFHFVGFNYLPVLDFIRRLSPDAKALVRQVRLTLLADPQGDQRANHDLFCTVIHDFLPGLNTLQADPQIYF